MTLGSTFICTHKHLRLFATQEAEGWKASVYDLDKSTFIYNCGWVFNTDEEAQHEAKLFAEGILREKIENPDWRESN